MMADVSCFTKFKLLLWKNWLLQWNHKGQILIELLLPMLFTMILVVLRYIVVPRPESKKTYPPVGINSLVTLFNFLSRKIQSTIPIDFDQYSQSDSLEKMNRALSIPKLIIPYSPNNSYLNKIMSVASRILKMDAKSFADAQTLEHELEINNYIAGVEFDDSMAKLTNYPEKLSFALRFPGELRTATMNSGISWQTTRLYPVTSGNYPRNYNETDGGTPIGYLREGFLPIQTSISMAFLKLAGGKPFPIVQMRRYPYPPFIYDPLLEGLQSLISLIFVLSFLYPCTCITKYVAHEKEKQLKEVMKIMGLSNWIHWTAWFVKGFGSLFLVSLVILVLIKTKWSNSVAVLTYSSWSAMLVFMIVYVVTSISFCLMLSVFFSKASTATAVTSLIWFMAYLPYILMIESYNYLSYGQKLGWCFLVNTAMSFGMKIVLRLEGSGEGLQWHNFNSPVNVDDNLTLVAVMIIMLISSIIYMIICLYVEQIFPGEYGVPKKWYFPFTKKFWCGENEYFGYKDFLASKRIKRDPDAFEKEPKSKFTGLQILNLKKRYGDKWALKGLTINMFEDEITVLLGHNGAGKTTTISMLTGLLTPTSGTAVINGYDIRTDIDGARSSLGFCPQYNVLFDDLSVANHIKFFCLLKGLKKREIQREIHKYLRLIDIEKKANTPASKLSGGMQRKLSVCCALCGGTKVVLCDEPSSGMDPAARRHMWNFLQNEKNGRTILLTTHFMDEADVLGDRIAIMCEGQLKCYGTPFFLKKKFGSGYTLTCTKSDGCDPQKVTDLLCKFIPGIVYSGNLGAELSYRLPYKFSNIFEEMLGVLEDKSEELGLNGYGISVSSMEEVFMKVNAENFSKARSQPIYKYYQVDDTDSLDSNPSFGNTILREIRSRMIVNQIRAMILKKMLYTWRKKVLFLIQNFSAILFVVMALYISRHVAFEALPPLLIHLTTYDSAVTVLEINPQIKPDSMLYKYAEAYKDFVTSFGPQYKLESTNGKDFQEYILQLGRTQQVNINKHYLAAASIGRGVITAWLNNQALHTAPLTVNLVFNALARELIGPETSIEVVNKPLKRAAAARIRSIQSGQSLGGQLASNIGFCMSFVTSMYILFLIKENESRAKLLQFVGGVRCWIFWMTHLIWDMLTFTFTVSVLIATILCFQEKYCNTFDELSKLFLFILVFGFAAIPLTYILASYFKEPATGFARVSTIYMFLGSALYVCVMVMSIPMLEKKSTADQLVWYFMIFPHFSLALGINELFMNAAMKDLCRTPALMLLPTELLCANLPECCSQTNAFSWERPGVLREIVYMLIVGGLCMPFLVIREYHCIRDICINLKRWIRNRPLPPAEISTDSDVAQEKARIRAMTKREIAGQNLVLNRVTKYYGRFLAVNQISLCVKQKECFGLLGLNGAGKTTTFKMLTGDEKLTYGQAYIRGYSITKKMSNVYTEIGYCPQFDALLEDLTAREMLRIFCLLKGVPHKYMGYLIGELAFSFGFMADLDKQIKNYSGGNKRKLSAALAIVGNPSVVYLDEPTTGMDPAARRRLWNVVCLVRDSGKAIVLTSHSMEECEALCTRLAIMVNGEFVCIGSIQHLKNKFSKGFILKIKVKSTLPPLQKTKKRVKIPMELNGSVVQEDQSSADVVRSVVDELVEESIPETDASGSHWNTEWQEDLLDSPDERERITNDSLIRKKNADRVRSDIEREFPSAVLQERYQGLLTYNIPIADVKWSQIFGFMERNFNKLNIEDYAVTQTTLEEIFLDFASNQVDIQNHSQSKGFSACLNSK